MERPSPSAQAAELAAANGEQALDAALGKAAGSGDVHRFGRQGDNFAFGERLDNTMNRVAGIAGGSEVENLRRHAVFSRSNGQRRSEPAQGDDAKTRSAGAG